MNAFGPSGIYKDRREFSLCMLDGAEYYCTPAPDKEETDIITDFLSEGLLELTSSPGKFKVTSKGLDLAYVVHNELRKRNGWEAAV